MMEHLSLFINFEEEAVEVEEKEVDEETKRVARLLAMPVEELELPCALRTVCEQPV